MIGELVWVTGRTKRAIASAVLTPSAMRARGVGQPVAHGVGQRPAQLGAGIGHPPEVEADRVGHQVDEAVVGRCRRRRHRAGDHRLPRQVDDVRGDLDAADAVGQRVVQLHDERRPLGRAGPRPG